MDSATLDLLREAASGDVDMLALDPAWAAKVAQVMAEFLRLEPAMVECIETADAGAQWREAIGDGRNGRKVNPWLAGVLDNFYAARQTWQDSCDEYSKGYETEAAEFAELWPKPRLADFMVDHSAARVVISDDGTAGPMDT